MAGDNRMELTWRLSEDRRTLTIEMLLNGRPLGHMFCDASYVEELANKLAIARSGMVEEVSRELDIGSRVEAIPDPIWRIPGELQHGGQPVFIRDPGFGWRGWLFPPHAARAFAKWLWHGLPDEPEASSDDTVRNG